MSEWSEANDPKSGRTYYYNKITKKTQWSRPPEMDGGAASNPAASGGDDPESNPALWAEGSDPKTGRVYFYNKVTKKTQWSKPACMGASAAATPIASNDKDSDDDEDEDNSIVSNGSNMSSAMSSSSSPSSASPSTDIWLEAKDPGSGRPYWYNKTTKATTWKNPNGAASGGSSSNGDDLGDALGGHRVAPNSQPLRNEIGTIKGIAGAIDTGYNTITAVKASAHVSAQSAFSQESEADKENDKKNFRNLLRDEDSDNEDDGKDGGGEADDNNVKRSQMQNEEDEEDDDETHEFKFAKHRKGWFNRVFRVGAHHDESKLLTFKKSQIKKALLKQNRDLDAEAVQCFKNIMSYMGDRKSSKPPIEHAKKMLRNLMIAPAGLRDEVYMQLCKQTTGNPNMESTTKGWELMSFCLATFPPSKHLKTFLMDYIKKNAEDQLKPKVQALAQLSFERLPTIVQMGQRKQVPSTLELQCLMDSKSVPIRVNLANGTFKTFTVDPYTTVKDVEDMLVKKYNLTVTNPFALYEAAEANVERILDPKDRVLDVVASWENPPLVEEVKMDPRKEKAKSYEKAPRNQIKVIQKEAKYNSLLYKAKLVLKTTNHELMSDPEAVTLVYIQATQDVVTQRYPSNDKDITVLAALQLQATFGDYKKDIHVPGWLKPKIAEFMPANLLEKKGKLNEALVAEWEQKILAKYMKVSGFTSLEAKLNYLDYVQEWVFYGSTFFLVEQRQFKDYPSPLTLGINCEGVLLMHPEKKTVLENYQYTDIVTWGHSDEKFIIVVGNIVQQRKLIFKTSDGKSMNHLIHDYVKFKVRNKEAQAQLAAMGGGAQ